MEQRKPLGMVFSLIVVVVAGLVALLTLGTPGEAEAGTLVGTGSSGSSLESAANVQPTTDAAAGTFRIAGSAARLYPGAVVPLVLTVTNPDGFVIVVTSLTVKVHGTSTACGSPYVSASSFRGALHVSAHGSSRETLTLSMHLSADNGCQGAQFTLLYSGLARKT